MKKDRLDWLANGIGFFIDATSWICWSIYGRPAIEIRFPLQWRQSPAIDDLLQSPRKGEAASFSSWLFSIRVDLSIDVRCASCRHCVTDDVLHFKRADREFVISLHHKWVESNARCDSMFSLATVMLVDQVGEAALAAFWNKSSIGLFTQIHEKEEGSMKKQWIDSPMATELD